MTATTPLFATVLLGVAAVASAQPAENLVLVTLDGLRWQELFGGAEEMLIDSDAGGVDDPKITRQRFWADTPEARRRLLMPFVWRQIAEHGVLVGDPDHGSTAVCTNGRFFSYPGYNEILCGFGDPSIDSNDANYNQNTTVLEWLHNQPGYKGRVAAFGSWDRFEHIINAKRCGFDVNSGWQPLKAFSDETADQIARLNQAANELPRVWGGVRYDMFTFRGAMAYLHAKQPRVLYVALGETDDWCHKGRYDLYLDSARRSDDYLRELWATLQSMPQYRGTTALLITTDHGRGSGREGWKNHGADLPGSDRIWLAALGAGVPSAGVVEGVHATQSQCAATAAALLGLDFTTTDDRVAEPVDALLATPVP